MTHSPLSLVQRCQDHLHEAKETYIEHLAFTVRTASYLFRCTIILLLHGLIPGIFQRTASTHITNLYHRLSKRTVDDNNQAPQIKCTMEWHI